MGHRARNQADGAGAPPAGCPAIFGWECEAAVGGRPVRRDLSRPSL